NVKVVDDLTGDEWLIETLNVGETKEFEATYTVTSDDILKGVVVNSVTGKGDPIPDPDPDKPPHTPEDDDDEDDPTDPIDTTMTVVKISDKQGQKVALNETIHYTITVTNEGNVPFTNVEVVDELTGDKWLIETLNVGETKNFTAEYVVTSDDILAGYVLNSVTAKGDPIPDPDPDVPPHTPEDDDDEEDDPEDVNATLNIEKVANFHGKATIDELIDYQITVTNEGNVPMYNVVVEDKLAKLHEVIKVLNVGETVNFTAYVRVTEEHVEAGHVMNVATAKADPIIDPNNPETPIIPEDKDEEDVRTEKTWFRVTVRYWYDEVGGKKAAPEFKADYFTGESYHVTSPRVSGYTPDISVVKGVMDKADVVYDVIYTANEYKLTIHYIYENGETAAPDFSDALKAGEKYEVESPVLEGYRTKDKVVKGQMPAYDVTVTVIYKKSGNYIIIEDYDMPLGLGNVNLNAGECFE
ncbi:MAG: MucBP domain-containing protein, partial [Clostridia bacterium]|nr:MucBP domain-containing protein [Clostridia bacterium]